MLGHVNYVSSNFADARDCYERTLAFVNDASEMHSIYLRLASIYLQEEQVWFAIIAALYRQAYFMLYLHSLEK